MRIIRLALLGAALLLGACSETRFSENLRDDANACEVDLSGVWRIEDDKGDSTDYLSVNADCAMALATVRNAAQESTGAPREYAIVHFRPTIARLGKQAYLSLDDASYHRIADAGSDKQGAPDHAEQPGFHFFKIEIKRKRFVVRAVDDEAVAKAIIDNRLRGTVRKVDDTLDNIVRVRTADLPKTLAARWLFRREDPIAFRRVDADSVPDAARAVLDSP
jgi:hypothetical protein